MHRSSRHPKIKDFIWIASCHKYCIRRTVMKMEIFPTNLFNETFVTRYAGAKQKIWYET